MELLPNLFSGSYSWIFQDPLYSADLLNHRFPTIINKNYATWTNLTLNQIYHHLKHDEHIHEKSNFLRIFQAYLIRQPSCIPTNLHHRFTIEINPSTKVEKISQVLEQEFATNSWGFLGLKESANILKAIYGIDKKHTTSFWKEHKINASIPPIPHWLQSHSPNGDGVLYGTPQSHLQNQTTNKQIKNKLYNEWCIQNQMYQILHKQLPNEESLKILFFKFNPSKEDLFRFSIFESIFAKM